MIVDFPELAKLAPPGLVLEFGVFQGQSLNYLAKCFAPRLVYGFDWFFGLQEAWEPDSNAPGLFSTNGQAPQELEPNAKLVIGKVEETVVPFFDAHPEPVALAHLDMDLYGPTKHVLSSLRYQHGTILAFDEADGQPRCSENEQRAFWEWLNETNRYVPGVRPKFLGRRHYTSWVIQVLLL